VRAGGGAAGDAPRRNHRRNSPFSAVARRVRLIKGKLPR
jgi:hypothetical protein